MNKLEEKLIELGYGLCGFETKDIYFKWVYDIWRIEFIIDDGIILDTSLGIGTIKCDIKENSYDKFLKQAYKTMMKDLKVVKAYEM